MGAGTKVAGGAGPKARYAAALAFLSQLILLWTLPGELTARPLSGSFVLLAAMGQGLLVAGLLFGPGRWAVRLGFLLNAGVVLVWAATRITGFPALFGFGRLPLEPLGVIATVIEISLVVLLLKIERGLKTERRKRRVRRKRKYGEPEKKRYTTMNSLSKISWGRVLLASVATHVGNVVVAVMFFVVYTLLASGPQGAPSQDSLDAFSIQLTTWPVPILTLLAAAWAARKAEPTIAAFDGLLVGFLVTVAFALLYFGSFSLGGLVLFVLTIGAGFVGGLIGQVGRK